MPVTFVATSNKNLERNKILQAKEAPPIRLGKAVETSRPFQEICRKPDNIVDPSLLSFVQHSTAPDESTRLSQFGLISAVMFSSYINGKDRAELLQDRIVKFNGKETLEVYSQASLFTADFGDMAVQMVDQIADNIKDPSLCEWFLPCFSTTTTTDQICAAVACMSAMQNYFVYRFYLKCCIPNVTLHGTTEDWTLLRSKIERLAEFDLDDNLMSAWLLLLRPVCDNFVMSAKGQPCLEFWDQICCKGGGGSGPTYLSGWITVFSVFNHEGEWQHSVPQCSDGQPHAAGSTARGGSVQAGSTERADEYPEMLKGWAGWLSWCHVGFSRPGEGAGKGAASAQGAEKVAADELLVWPRLDTVHLNHNVMTVPVEIIDGGTMYRSTMFAGQFVFETLEEGCAVRPRNDWAIALYSNDLPADAKAWIDLKREREESSPIIPT